MNPNPFETPKHEHGTGRVTNQQIATQLPCRPIFEVLCAGVGLIGAGTMLTVVFFRNSLPESVFEFFRGGNFGGVLLGLSLLAGFIAIPMFFINLISGCRSWWAARLALVTCDWALCAIVSSMM